MQFFGRVVSAAVGVLTLTLAAACGGGSNAGSTQQAGTPAPATSVSTPAQAQSADVNPCTLLKANDFVTQFGGGTFTFGDRTGPADPYHTSGCTIEGTNVPIDGKSVTTRIGVATLVDDAAGTLWKQQAQIAAAFEAADSNDTDTLIQTEKSGYSARKGSMIVQITSESASESGAVSMPDDAALNLAKLAQSRLP